MWITIAPRLEPLEDNQEVHIPKYQYQEYQLRNSLKPKLHFSPVINWVRCFNQYTQCHMHHTNDNWDFHLQTVDVVQIVLCDRPYWIYTKRIDTVILSWYGLMLSYQCRVITWAEQIQVDTQEVIVNKSTICRKESHHSKQVPMWNNHNKERTDICKLIFFPYHNQTKQEEQQSMSNITKHNTKQEGESDSCEQWGISLSIFSNTIGLYDILCWTSIWISLE